MMIQFLKFRSVFFVTKLPIYVTGPSIIYFFYNRRNTGDQRFFIHILDNDCSGCDYRSFSNNKFLDYVEPRQIIALSSIST